MGDIAEFGVATDRQRRRLISVAIPPIIVLVTREHVGVPGCWTEGFDVGVGADGLCGMSALADEIKWPFQQGRVIGQRDDGVAPHRHDDVLALPFRPMAAPHTILRPCDDRLWLKAPCTK